MGPREKRLRLKLTTMDAAIIFGAVMGLICSLFPLTRLLP